MIVCVRESARVRIASSAVCVRRGTGSCEWAPPIVTPAFLLHVVVTYASLRPRATQTHTMKHTRVSYRRYMRVPHIDMACASLISSSPVCLSLMHTINGHLL